MIDGWGRTKNAWARDSRQPRTTRMTKVLRLDLRAPTPSLAPPAMLVVENQVKTVSNNEDISNERKSHVALVWGDFDGMEGRKEEFRENKISWELEKSTV